MRLAVNAFVVQAGTDGAAQHRRDAVLARADHDLIALYGKAVAASRAESWRHLSAAELIDPYGGFASDIVGSADTLRRRLEHYAEAGADVVPGQLPDMATDIGRFGRSVLPVASFEARHA